MELEFGEVKLWSGKPKQGLVFSNQDIILIPFSILWCGFAIFWELSVISQDSPGFFALWGIPFVLIGLYFTFGRFIHDYIIRKNTDYIITDKRIILKKYSKTESIGFGNWSCLKLEEFSNDYGNILFAEPLSLFARRRSWSSMLSSNFGVPAFFKIKKAKQVYDIIQDQMKK